MSISSLLSRRALAFCFAVLGIATLCGFVMQNVLAQKTGTQVAMVSEQTQPALPKDKLPQLLNSPPSLQNRIQERKLPVQAEVANACEPWLSVTPAPAAAVRINLSAPCHANETLTLRHKMLEITGKTDATGHFKARIPVFERTALIELEFAGKTLLRVADVVDAVGFEHVAVQWTGPQNFKMHAYEFGAQDHQFGHVWSGSPKSHARSTRGSGGFLTHIGAQDGKSAEIYSFPSGNTSLQGTVDLVVEAEVTNRNCGQRVFGTAIQSGALGELFETEIAIKMPTCDRIGERLRLQNVLHDMRLATR